MNRWNSVLAAPWGPGRVAPDRWRELWDLLPPHPGRAHKAGNGRPTGWPGIYNLFVADDAHVFIGHGDGMVNDGSTLLVSLDPASGTYTAHGAHNTEELSVFRRAPDGSVWSPYVDPTGYWESTPPAAVWPTRGLGTIDAIHVFDLLHHADRIWCAGSTHAPGGLSQAAVWYSDDDGATWTRTTPSGATGNWDRAYRIGVGLDGRVCVLLGSNYWNKWGEWYTWDGSGWTPGADPGPDPHQPQTPPPGVLIPPDSVFARTSTHWVMGTSTGDIYVIPAD